MMNLHTIIMHQLNNIVVDIAILTIFPPVTKLNGKDVAMVDTACEMLQ